jgi:outer membrane protein OmpA-like peptidoglycan-associated protein
MVKILSLSITLVLLSTLGIMSQEKEIPMNIGIYGGLNLNMHSPDFEAVLPAKVNKSATTFGGNFGGIGNFPIDNTFVITGRLGYNMLGGELEDNLNNLFTSSVGLFEITPGVQFHNLIPSTDLYFLAAMEFGVPVSKTYTYGSVVDAEIPEMNTRVALGIGAGWMFEISDKIYLTPEVSYRIPFNHVSESPFFSTWDIPQLRVGLNLTFGFGKEEKTVTKELGPAEVNVGFKEVRAYDKNGNVKPATKISVEEVQYAEQFPIIPYVFFPEKSEQPDATTQSLSGSGNEAGVFKIENLESNAEKINSSTLDIVGARMQKDKNVAIKIVGTIDGRGEANNKELALKRAEFAKNYLVNTYGISDNRITTEAGSMPSKPSSLRDPLGIEENRRIEIYALNSSTDLFDPLVIQSDRQRLASPDVIEFVPYAETTDSIIGWELEVMQAGKLIKKYSGAGIPDASRWSILPNELAASEIPVDYTFKAWTNNKKTSTANGTIPVEYFSITRKKSEERADRTISKYSLMLFDFNSPEVSELDKKIMINSIVPAIKFNSTVQIYGYTDVIGDADYNKKLALQRAVNVQEFLKSNIKDAKYEAFGVGESVQIFDNKTTVGRQLSRTVQVYVITPKN